MKFTNIESIKTAVNTLSRDRAGRRVFGVTIKKAITEYILNNSVSKAFVGDAVGIDAGTLGNWKKQYHEGLFSLDGCVRVSKPVLQTNIVIKQQLKDEINLLTKKLRLIEQCEEMGLTIAV